MNGNHRLDAITGFAAVSSSIIGVASLVATIVAFLSGQFVITRACLIVAALAFGLLANAVFLGPRLSQHKPQGGP